jgi:hypothetical protein
LAHHKSPSVYAVILTFIVVEKAACQKFAKNPGKPI